MSFILINLIFLFISPGPLTAPSAILINSETGHILYEKNSHELRSPASILKIATCAYALQLKGDQLDTPIETPQDCIGAVAEGEKKKKNYSQPAHWLVHDASHMGLKKGEILTFRDLLYGMMVSSADDASNVIAYFAGDGSISHFMDGLNAWVRSIGARNTTFKNPHGLYHPEQRTTAYDMALIAREAMKDPLFKEIVKTVKYTRPKTNKQDSTQLIQTNLLLRKGKWHYPYATGIKTGKIEHSGFGLVSSAEKNDRSLIAVVLGCKESGDRFQETIRLFDTAFNEPKVEKLLFSEGKQSFTRQISGIGTIHTALTSPLKIGYYPSEEPHCTATLTWSEVKPPLLKGEQVALITLIDPHQKVLATAPLVVHSVKEQNFLLKFWDRTQLNWHIAGGALFLLILMAFAWRFSH